MKQNRLFKKFLAIFVCLILIPFLLLLLYLIFRANQLQLKNDLAQNENLALQTMNTVHQQNELARNMCRAVVQNQNLVDFLDKQYETMPDLLYYRTTIRDFVKVTNGVSDTKLQIYLENESIPMGFGIFYPMEYISQTRRFQQFYASDAESIWLADEPGVPVARNRFHSQEKCYHFLHKIQVASRCIGVIDAQVPERAYAITDLLSNRILTPKEWGRCQVYNYSGRELKAKELREMTAAEGTGYDRELVYSFEKNPAGPFDILVVTSRSGITNTTGLLALLVPVLFLALTTGFSLYNRQVIRDIHSCLDGMEMAIENNFEMPRDGRAEPIEQALQRNDEISVLASRINYLLQQIRTLLAQKIQQQTAAKEAQLLALQHQINPHFLYNTMEVFSSRMELAGLYEESGAISAFCRMLRYNMNTKELMTTLADEIGQVKYYLAIQKIRRIPFAVDFDIPKELMGERIIRFLLEPFVENSFKYRGTASPLKILISVRDAGQSIEVTIRNNGQTLTPQRMEELNQRFRQAPATVKTQGEHIGLNNINSRLKLFYGEEHFIQVGCENGETVFRFLLDRQAPAAENPPLL